MSRRSRLSFDGRNGPPTAVQDYTVASVNKASSVLQDATILISESIWNCLSESFGTETCNQGVAERYQEYVEIRPVNITTDSRALSVERITGGFDRLVENAKDLEPESLAVIHNTASLLDLYRKLWLEKFKNNSDFLIPHERKCLLVNWASSMDTKFDPEDEFNQGLETIKAAEKRQISLAEINRPFYLTPIHSKAVSKSICRLFLFGYWSSAIHLLDRCYSISDDALNDFNGILLDYYPHGSYDLQDPENHRHPFHNIELLTQFRQDIKANLVERIQLSDDHLLKDLLIILSDQLPNENAMEDAICSSPGELKLQEFVFAPEHDQSLISTFILNLFWFPERCESLCADLDLNDQNAIGFIFQRWWHELKFDVEELPSTVIAYALTLGQYVDKLHEHLFWAGKDFVPMFAFSMFWLVFYDFPVDTNMVTNNFFPALLELCDVLSSESWIQYDTLLRKIANPYTLFLKIYRSSTTPFIPETLAKTISNKPITSLTTLKVVKLASRTLTGDRETHRQFYFECLKLFLLSRGNQVAPSAKLSAILELNDIAAETLDKWTQSGGAGQRQPPRYAVKAAALGDAWLKSIENTIEESKILDVLQTNHELRQRIWSYLDGPLKPLRAIQLAALADTCSESGDCSLIVYRIHNLLREMSLQNVNGDRMWNLLARIVELPNVTISNRLWQDLAKSYPALVSAMPSINEKCQRLAIFRALALCTTEDHNGNEYLYKVNPHTSATTLRS